LRWIRPLAAAGAALVAAPAAAHRPHTPILTAALSPGYSDNGRAWAVKERRGLTTLIYTDDHGAHWNFLSSPPMVDRLIDAAYAGDDLVLLGADGSLWTSSDEGESWRADDTLEAYGLTAREMAWYEQQVLVATDQGLFEGSGGELTRISELPTSRVVFARGTTGRGLAVAEGAVWLAGDGAMGPLPELPDGAVAHSVAGLEGDVLVGAEADGAIYRLAEGSAEWTRCGALPDAEATEEDGVVVRLEALPDGRLAAATGRRGVYLSEDVCDSWELRDTKIYINYGGENAAPSVDDGFTELLWREDRWMVGSYDGISVTQGDPTSWRVARIVPADFARGVSIAPDYPEDLRIFWGSYSGGAAWTEDGGASWGGSAAGLGSVPSASSDLGESNYAYDISVSDALSEDSTAYYVGAYLPFRASAPDWSWEIPEGLSLERVSRFIPADGRTWAVEYLEEVGAPGTAAWTDDSGETWHTVDAFADFSSDRGVSALADTCLGGEPALLFITTFPWSVAASWDDGESWEELASLGGRSDSTQAAVGTWPPGSCERAAALVNAGQDIWISDDAGVSWREATRPPAVAATQVFQADDGTWFLSGVNGTLFRSDDGADTWDEVGPLPPPPVLSADTSRDFATTGLITLGTYAGVFWSDDRGESWYQLPRYQRFEDQTIHLVCNQGGVNAGTYTSTCERYSDDTQGNGGGYVLRPTDTLDFSFEGHAFRAVGDLSGASLEVWVDGTHVGDLSEDAPAFGGLEAGRWHDVKLRNPGTATTELAVDLVEAWGEGEPLPGAPQREDTGAADSGDTGAGPGDTAPVDSGGADSAPGEASGGAATPAEPGCSCGGGGAGALPWLPALLALAARRRRSGARGRRRALLVGLLALLAGCGDRLTDDDGDAVLSSVDCDDGDPGVYPGAPETCDGVDQDCDGAIDEAADDATTWYADADGDGYGDSAAPLAACDAPADSAAQGGDCDDGDPARSPGAAEDCDGVDNNCDEEIDEGFDLDGDGWRTCDGDCDDGDAGAWPGAAEVWYDGVDGDCAGDSDFDADGDGYDSDLYGGDDCDDSEPAAAPLAEERFDGLDNNCDGTIDEGSGAWLDLWEADATLFGEAAGDRAGISLEGVGDFNGDGLDDLAVGAMGEGPGMALLVLGDPALRGEIDLAGAAMTLTGEAETDRAAEAGLAGVGDVDGDGRDDFLVGAAYHNGVGTVSGRAYLVLGGDLSRSSLGEADAILDGESPSDRAGDKVDGGGDVDGDGVLDLLVSAPNYSLDESLSGGAIYVVSGDTRGTVSLGDATARVEAEAYGDLFGRSVSTAGDVNGDGLDDVIAGAQGDDTAAGNAGAAYLLLGPLRGVVSAGDADAKYTGQHEEEMAGRTAVRGVGDTDGDGLDDVAIGAAQHNGVGAYSGATYLVLGRAAPAGGSLADADAVLLGEGEPYQAGRALAAPGDVDGDGLDDILIGSPHESDRREDSGAAYLALSPHAGAVSLTGAAVKLGGRDTRDLTGWAVGAAGDPDGDGIPDLLVGAPYADIQQSSDGAGYLILGGGL
jgi:hypothetical protein